MAVGETKRTAVPYTTPNKNRRNQIGNNSYNRTGSKIHTSTKRWRFAPIPPENIAWNWTLEGPGRKVICRNACRLVGTPVLSKDTPPRLQGAISISTTTTNEVLPGLGPDDFTVHMVFIYLFKEISTTNYRTDSATV